MNEIPKVSVIIPTHNHANFLPESLTSVKNQTYKNYEVIVVNNGSTDNTEQVIRNLTWDKLRHHFQDDTGSVAGPRNTGIRLASGEYVAFLDSDDLWYENKLEKVMSVLENNKEIDILSHDLYMSRQGKKKRLIRVGPLKDDIFKSLLIKNCLLGSATVVKRKVMLEVEGFDESKHFVHTEDYETWLRIAYLKKNFYFINEPLGEYKVHSFNLSFDFENVLLHEKNVIDKHIQNFKNNVPFEKYLLYCAHLSVIYSKMSIQYFFRRKYCKCIYSFLKAFLLNPFCTCSTYFSVLITRI